MTVLIKEFNSESGLQLELHSSAVNHILFGDIADRVIRNENGTVLEKILKGGLHTYEGWKIFSSYHADAVHVLHFNSNYHSSWYYTRELQNKVITLRLPRYLFSGKAAKITKFPDDYYKSGYLWKTLFPEGFDEKDLVSTIEEALNNIDTEASKEGEIVGYANINDPLMTVRIVIMFRDNKINSVFPSWSQPCTGNTGKAFSHFDNIGNIISYATVFFDEEPIYEACHESFVNKNHLTKSLIDNTPAVFKVRTKPKSNTRKWRIKRDTNLEKISKLMRERDIESIYKYLTDFEICKNYDFISKNGYGNDLAIIEKSLGAYNAYQIHQNIIDSLTLLHSYDNYTSKNYFHLAVIYLLENMVTFVGIDSWVKRRIYHKIITLLPSYHNIVVIKDFIIFLSEAPSRRELFIEFSFDTQVKKDLKGPFDEFPPELDLIQNPNLSIKIEYRHYLEYLKENLGENYLLFFNNEQRAAFAIESIKSGGRNNRILINDIIRYTDLHDFNSFPESFEPLIQCLISNNDVEGVEDSIHRIMRDYCRMQTAQRFRLNLLHKDYLHLKHEPLCEPSEEYVKYKILEHERFLNTMRVEIFLDTIENIVPLCNDKKMEDEISMYREKAKKDIPPGPESLPNYIVQRRKKPGSEHSFL